MAPACDLIDGLTAEYVIADRAYDADRLYQKTIDQGGDPVVPPRCHRKRQHAYDKALYKERNRVERFFRSLPHARAVLEDWRRDYNEQRPHSKLGWMTPRDYARALSGEAGDRAAQPGGSARTPLATHQNQGSDQPRTLVMAG
jgi:putative transposase